jgi:hypothetical protein
VSFFEILKENLSNIESVLTYTPIYITSNTVLPKQFDVADVEPLFDLLRNGKKHQPLLLILRSNGGSLLTVLTIAKLLKEFYPEYSVLVSLKAKSAATILCLGARKVYLPLGSHLSPVNPVIFNFAKTSYVSLAALRNMVNGLEENIQKLVLDQKFSFEQIMGFASAHGHEQEIKNWLLENMSLHKNNSSKDVILDRFLINPFVHDKTYHFSDCQQLELNVERPSHLMSELLERLEQISERIFQTSVQGLPICGLISISSKTYVYAASPNTMLNSNSQDTNFSWQLIESIEGL